VENTTNKFLEQQWAPRISSSGKLSHGKHELQKTLQNLCVYRKDKYMDDTFVSMTKSKLSEFLTHLNTTESSISLTMEKERE